MRVQSIVGMLMGVCAVAAVSGLTLERGPAPIKEAQAQIPLPTPRQFVSGLDLECYQTPGPGLNVNVQLSHLNPVLQQLGLPAHVVGVRELVQTCVPVAKNNVAPHPAALPFIRHVDLACYRVEAAQLAQPVSLALRHLNPVLQNLPQHQVRLLQPEQLCVPVAKNNVAVPADIARLVRYIDLECYRSEPGPHPNVALQLTQLNPQLTNIPPHVMNIIASAPRHTCVPVRKNNQAIPADVLNIIRWLDLEKFRSANVVAIPPRNVLLSHLNPLFVGFPRPQVTLQTTSTLAVPVAKNGAIPPG